MPAAMLAGRLNMPSPTTDLTSISRDEVFTADEKPPRGEGRAALYWGPPRFFEGMIQVPRNPPRREDDITVAVDPTCYI